MKLSCYKQLGICVLLSSFFLACEPKIVDESEPFPVPSTTPVISFRGVNATAINEFDELVFEIFYVDGDGNLGSPDADQDVVFVIDERDSIVSGFHVPPLNPSPGEALAIEGILEVNLQNVILLNDSSNLEQAVFSVFLMDQDSNRSNVVQSPVISISR